MQKKSARKRGPREKLDWDAGRRLHELEGRSFTDIAKQIGCRRNAVAARAKKYSWVNRADTERKASAVRAENIFLEFVERDAEAIRANLAKKHEAASLLLDIAVSHAKRLKDGTVALLFREGKVLADEDPILAARRVGLLLQTVEVVDRSIAGLKDAGWRSGAGDGGESSEADEQALQASLDELEEEES